MTGSEDSALVIPDRWLMIVAERRSGRAPGARHVWLPLAALALMSGFGGGSLSGSAAISPRDRSSSDVFELSASFDGEAAKLFGPSHEWYSPAKELYHVDHGAGAQRLVDVYDGVTITRRTNAGLFRIEGERAMLRSIVSHPVIFTAPAIVAVRRYLHGQQDRSFVVGPRDGGRSLAVDWHYVDEGIDTHIRYRVQVRSRLSLSAARRRGLLRAPTGAVVGIFKQSPPGTHSHFGERAYGFGRRFGPATAATALERSGGDPFTLEASRQRLDYTTMYRLPKSALPFPVKTAGTYPGLGAMLPLDVRVQCQANGKGFLPGLPRGTPGTPVRLQNGQRATLYLTEYRQGEREGVTADIVVGKTVCFVSGLISPAQLRRLAPTLRSL